MAEQFDDGSKLLGCSADNLRSPVVQNDQAFIDNTKEDLTHESSSNESEFDKRQSPAKCFVSLTDYQDEKHQNQAVENHYKSMVGLRQEAVDNPSLLNDIPTSSGNVVEGLNGTVEHHQPVCGMVDRRQSTVDDTDGHPMAKHTYGTSNTIIGTQFTEGSTQLGIAGEVVDHQKRSVEDDTKSVQNGRCAASTTQTTGIRFTPPGMTANVVDRQKKTVEDDTPSVQVTGANGDGVANATQVTGMQPTTSGINGNMVDRQKKTVEDDTPSVQVRNTTQTTPIQFTPPGMTGNVVDRQKKTVEDDTRSVHGVNSPSVTSSTQITGMQPTISGITGNMVDRQKRTVEDDIPSALVTTGANGHNTANATQIQPHPSGGMQPPPSGETGCIVDRERKTVEDDAPSVQVKGVNGGHPNGGTGFEQQFREGCNIGDRQRTNSHPEAAKWKVQLHVSSECNKDIIQHLPRSKSFEWNKSVVFGRGDNVDIFINDDHASRNHVELMGQTLPNGQVLFMARNISSKGYNINEENITDTDRWIPLKRTDNIKIAGLMCFVDIINGRDMDGFVIEFRLPEIQPSPVMTIPTPVYPVPFSPNGQAGFYNQYPIPYAGFQPVHLSPAYLPPNNGTMPGPMQQYWPYGMQPGQPVAQHHQYYLAGDLQPMETTFQQYQGREGYVKLEQLRYLAQDAVGEWTELGRALKLADWELEVIERDYKKSVEQSYQMLKTWVCSNPEQATLENLKKALEDVTVGRGDLALKYCTVSTDGDQNDHDSMATDNNANDGNSNNVQESASA